MFLENDTDGEVILKSHSDFLGLSFPVTLNLPSPTKSKGSHSITDKYF